MEKEKWVYKFKLSYYGPELGGIHNHSGLIIAYDSKNAFDKLYDTYHEVYVDSLDEGEKDCFDICTITISEYGDIMNDIIPDEEDEYYGV